MHLMEENMMKRHRRARVDRRSFLTSAAVTVAGIVLNSPLTARADAIDAKVRLDVDDDSGLMIMQTDQAVRKKICMLGASAVGKTSLVRRYVESIYDDK